MQGREVMRVISHTVEAQLVIQTAQRLADALTADVIVTCRAAFSSNKVPVKPIYISSEGTC